jgi:hypothetical protein
VGTGAFDESVVERTVQQWPQQAHPRGRVPFEQVAQPAPADLGERLEAVHALQPLGPPNRNVILLAGS